MDIIFVGNYQLISDDLKSILVSDNYTTVKAKDRLEFLNIVDNQSPDIAIVDVEMPETDGIEMCQQAIMKSPELKILALIKSVDHERLFKVIHARIKGIVLNTAEKDELITAIQTLATGGTFFSDELLREVLSVLSTAKKSQNTFTDLPVLTESEKEVLQLICNGYSNIEIAEKINTTVQKIEGYHNDLLKKTSMKSTMYLILYAIRNKLIEI